MWFGKGNKVAYQIATVNGVKCVVDSGAPTTPVSDVTGDGGDVIAGVAALLANRGTGLSGGKITENASGTIAIASGTITVSAPVIDATQTWNASGTTFTGQKLNVTDTASASGSMLFDYQVGGSTRFKAAVGNSRDSVLTITSPTQHADLNLVGSDRSGLLRSAGGGNGLAITGGRCEIWGSGGTTAGIIEGLNNNNTTQYYRITGQGVSFNNSKALTESAATAFVRIAVASGSHVGGRIKYTIVANDGTDYQTRSGMFNFSLVNKGGTETAGLGTVMNESVAVSTGTLTVTFDTDTSPTNAVDIRANAVSSLTQTTLQISYWVEIDGPAVTITPQ